MFLPRKDGILSLCVSSRDLNNLTNREPMLIAIEAAKLLIAWAVPDVVFHPVKSDRRILWDEYS